MTVSMIFYFLYFPICLLFFLSFLSLFFVCFFSFPFFFRYLTSFYLSPLFSYQRSASTLHTLIPNSSDIPFYFSFSFDPILFRFSLLARSRVLFLLFSPDPFWAGCLFLLGRKRNSTCNISIQLSQRSGQPRSRPVGDSSGSPLLLLDIAKAIVL